MDPNIWGKHAWIFLHTVVEAYPDKPLIEDKDNMRNFFYYSGNVLPCLKCKINFKKHMKEIPLTDDILSSKNRLRKWLIDIHNEVNLTTGKKVLSYHSAQNCILRMYKKKDRVTGFQKVLVIIIFIIIFMILFLVHRI